MPLQLPSKDSNLRFLEKTMMVAAWMLPVNFLSNDISNIMASRSFGLIRFLPHIGAVAFVFAITVGWWYFKYKENCECQEFLSRRHRDSRSVEASQTPKSFIMSNPEDLEGCTSSNLQVQSFGDGSQDASDSSETRDASRLNEDLHQDPETLPPPRHCQDNEGIPAESTGTGGEDVVNGDSRTTRDLSCHPSTGSNGCGVSDPTNNRDTANLEEALQKQPWLYEVLVVHDIDHLATIVENFQPDVNLPGLGVLQKRNGVGPPTQTGHEVHLEIMENMKKAIAFDKHCTMQLGSLAVLKDRDAGLKWWMLHEEWTPVILDLHRSPPSFFDLLAGVCPKWTLQGFNLETATLRIASTENSLKNSEDLTILHRDKTEKGVEVLLFHEPCSFPMFSKKVYISASNDVEVEEGMTFKLHSEAKQVQRAFWTSVADSSIPSPLAGFLIASLLLLGEYVFGTQWKFFAAYWLALVPPLWFVHALASRQESARSPMSNPTWKLELNDMKILEISDELTGLLGPFFHHLNPILQATAAMASENLAQAVDSQRLQIVSENRDLAILVRSLSQDYIPKLQITAADTLGNLASQSESSKLAILNQDGALSHLVRSLAMSRNPVLQATAAGALMKLTYKGETSNNLKILNESLTLASLVRSLSLDLNPALQANAAGVLWNLAVGAKEDVKLKISNEDGALAGLVKSLSQSRSPRLQANAAGALGSLAVGVKEVKLKVSNEEGALVGLVRSLSQDYNPNLQAYAAGALKNLTAGTEEIKLKILNVNGALLGLISSLSCDDNPLLQTSAAGALRNLAIGAEDIKHRIVMSDGALAALRRCVSLDVNPNLQANAAGALQNLALGDKEIRMRILKEPGVLGSLVESSSEGKNLNLRANAAGALCNLALRLEKSNQIKIVNEGDLLFNLVASLFHDDNPILQVNAARALSSLASGGEWIILEILETGLALSGLVCCLEQDVNPNVQANAAEALSILATGGETIKLEILDTRGALAGLVGALSRDEDPGLQVRAAQAMMKLAEGSSKPMKRRIMNQDGALEGLVKCLYKPENPNLQAVAAGALGNLATGGEAMRRRILQEHKGIMDLLESMCEHENSELRAMARGTSDSLRGLYRVPKRKVVTAALGDLISSTDMSAFCL